MPVPIIDDNTRFTWRKADDDHYKYLRELAGAEVALDVYSDDHNDHLLFIGAQIESQTTLPNPTQFLEHARQAWAGLRRKVPTIAAGIDYGVTGTAFLTYRIPTAGEVDAWLDRTVRIEETINSIDLLRTHLSTQPAKDEHGHLTRVYIVPKSDNSFGVLFHTSHVPFDASAGYIVMRHFLEELAVQFTSVPPPSRIDEPWGDEAVCLCPCAPNILGPAEVKQGDPRYDQTLVEILTDAEHGAKKNRGLKPRMIKVGRTVRLERVLSVSETELLLSAGRKRGFTLNQVVHAALTLMVLRDNPPPEDSDEVIAYFAFVNARKRLAYPYNEPRAFPGIAIAMSIMTVPISMISGPERANDQLCLFKLADHLKNCYQKQKENPALLSAIVRVVEYLIMPGKEARLAGLPFPNPWIAPWWSGDGIIEKHLDQQYADSAGKVTFGVKNCFISVNRSDPAPAFRCHTWHDQLYLSIDFNEGCLPPSDAEHIIDDWKRLVSLFATT